MSLQTIAADVKSRAQQLGTRSQKIATISLDGLKQANHIVVDHSQSLFNAQIATSRDLLESAKAGFSRARSDGFKAVLSAPTGYLPPREKLTNVFADTHTAFTKTRDELVKIAKDGYAAATHDDVAQATRKAVGKVTKSTKKAVGKTTKAAKTAAAEVKA